MIRIACTRSAGVAALLLFGLVLFAGPALAQDPNERCQRCHGESWILQRSPQALAAMVRPPETGYEFREPNETAGLYVDREDFAASAHGSISCQDCHTGIASLPHDQFLDMPACTDCHIEQEHELALGVHDPAAPGTPSCTDCHDSAHTVRPADAPRTYRGAVQMVEQCATCHADDGAYGFDPAQTYHDSIHGDAIYRLGLVQGPLCSDCHGTHTILPKENPESLLHPTNVSDTCGSCHQGIVEKYEPSVHGLYVAESPEEAPTCVSCHHSHGIEEVSQAFLTGVIRECSDCHLDLGASYLRSYHGKARNLGHDSVAICSSCHGAHDILPASNPASRISEENLVETCGACHPGANENFVQYIAHVDFMDPDLHPAVFYAFWGMIALLCSVLAFFIPHSVFWFQRTLVGRLRNPAPPHRGSRMVRRFSLTHRFTHGLIVVSFLGLVATGFPLKYSETEWAHRLTAVFGGVEMMGLLHRIFAVTTAVYVLIHLWHLAVFFVRDCPRPRWRYLTGPDSMLFSWKDVKDFFAMIRWFFWLGPRPRFGRWTYFEKFDYWGEIWGVIIIGGTGVILWWPTFFTQWFPGWVLNVAMVIHSIEALLAASVIFLVHFFNTHLRPEKFPIDMTMWTGQIPEAELKEERPAQYEQLLEANQLEQEIVEPMPLRWRVLGAGLGMAAFAFGIMLIILAIRTEITAIFG